MKRFRRCSVAFVAVMIVMSFILPLTAGAAFVGDREITSRGAVVMDFETGEVLFGHNADTQLVPASMIKMVAVHIIFDEIAAGRASMDTGIRISADTSAFSRNPRYSNVPLAEGSVVPVRTLLDYVVIRSAGAATVALGEGLFGSEAELIRRMNQKASDLGVQATFIDSWGASPDNRISPRGMAVMSRALIREYPEVLAITAKRSVIVGGVSRPNSNLLLGEYTGLDGFKTGFTNPAGYCFIGTAQQGGVRIISVTMGSTLQGRYPDSRALLDYGFANVGRPANGQPNIDPPDGSQIDDDPPGDTQPGSERPVVGPPAGTAFPSSANLAVDGESMPLSAFNINGFHYFKLRDIAYLLNGSGKQFEVVWDEVERTISIISGEEYTPEGGELVIAANVRHSFSPTASKIFVDGEEMEFDAYFIEGNNYFRLRDIGEVLDFGVVWESETLTVLINTFTGYHGRPESVEPPEVEDLPGHAA